MKFSNKASKILEAIKVNILIDFVTDKLFILQNE